MKPKEPEPPKVEKPPDSQARAAEARVKKPEPPKPAPPTGEAGRRPSRTAEEGRRQPPRSILKNNDKTPPIKTPQQSPQKPKEITRQVAMAPEFATVVTASEVEGVRQKIRPCWNSFGGAKEAPVVSLVVQMNQNGTPVEARVQGSRPLPRRSGLSRGGRSAGAPSSIHAASRGRCHRRNTIPGARSPSISIPATIEIAL